MAGYLVESFYPYLNREQQQINFFPEENSDNELLVKINSFLDSNTCDALFISNMRILESCWQVLKKRNLKVPEAIVLITHHGDNQCVDYPTAYFEFSIFQIATEILNVCHESKLQKKFINAEFHCLENLKKGSVIDKMELSRQNKSRNCNLEMAHI